jgi:hypothetical protein
MSEGKETTLERLALSAVKSEMLTHEMSLDEGELGLQPVSLAYSQQVLNLNCQ